jgi:DNA-directed RNA polymerase subunit omega
LKFINPVETKMTTEETQETTPASEVPEIDSKYRLIILAAKRSKQLQRGARPRIDIDALKHKNTRIALEEVMSGRVNFSKTDEEKI